MPIQPRMRGPRIMSHVLGMSARSGRAGAIPGAPDRIRHSAALACLLSVTLALAFAGCTLRLVADYDEQIDRGATELQQQMDAHLTRLEALGSHPDAAFAANQEFYREYGVRLRSLGLRAQAHRRNETTIEQLQRMEASLQELREQHERGGTLSTTFIAAARELFNSSWGAIIAWEIAKRRGAR